MYKLAINAMLITNSIRSIMFLVILLALTTLKSISSMPAHSSNIQVKKLPSLNWSPDNHLFNSQTHTGINYYLKLNAHIGDSIDLVCGASTHGQYSIIYKVSSKHEFDNCIVNPQNVETVPILKCGGVTPNHQESTNAFSTSPNNNNQVKFTIYFVKFSPVPNALEFEEDKEYYFLSTSSGTKEGLNYMSGGLCSNFNMRFSIKIDSGASNTKTLIHHLNSEFYPLKHQDSNHPPSQFQSAILSSISSSRDFDSTRLIPYVTDKLNEDESVRLADTEIGFKSKEPNDANDDDADQLLENDVEHLTNSQPQVSSKLNLASSSTLVSRSNALFFIVIFLKHFLLYLSYIY